ncbi:uncharacterized protein LOC126667871 [Mercurialis annua]|uniref:uncharacterized protein LOC126667871 n=1 Tax=Mercurialis annua TaxID=3986 RepID=UPI00215F1EAB|nr:uncharacterized protein LOC126667871 [Mercurialis annua]
MAYRRRQQQSNPAISTSYSINEEEEDGEEDHQTNSSSPTSLAAKAIRASSAAHRDSSLSSAYAFNHRSSATATAASTTTASRDSKPHEYTSMKNLNESKQGFWGALSRKAKSFLDDDAYASQHLDSPARPAYNPVKPKHQNPYTSQDSDKKTETPKLQKGLTAISSSLNYIGNAVEEGLTIVENRTSDIIQGTRKHIRKKPSAAAVQNQATYRGSSLQQPQLQTQMQRQMQTDQELQIKASRDVAMAMAAKAKLLLRELKTVKADFAFAKERCAQLEEENRILREHRERGDSPEDDDLIRLQLETLLSEKARLAHENSVYARENRFLREVVEYHQLTMQDVVYLDESTEEVTEVYPIKVVSNTQSFAATSLSPEASLGSGLQPIPDAYPRPVPPPGLLEVPKSSVPSNLRASSTAALDTKDYSSSG